MKVLAWLAPPPRFNGKIIDAVANLSDFAFFVIAIWGSVEVFGEFRIGRRRAPCSKVSVVQAGSRIEQGDTFEM